MNDFLGSTVLHGLVTVCVYIVIAWLTTYSQTSSASEQNHLIIFPIVFRVRLLGWLGGIACAVVGIQGTYAEGMELGNVLLILIAAGTVFLPLQTVAISDSDIRTFPILFIKGQRMAWTEVNDVVKQPAGRLIIVKGNGKTITHTRFNADPIRFESLVQHYVNLARKRK